MRRAIRSLGRRFSSAPLHRAYVNTRRRGKARDSVTFHVEQLGVRLPQRWSAWTRKHTDYAVAETRDG